MRPRVGDCSISAARSNEQPPPGRTAANQQHILRLIVTWLSIRAPCSSCSPRGPPCIRRSEEHTSELQSQSNLVCRLLLEKKKIKKHIPHFLILIIDLH